VRVGRRALLGGCLLLVACASSEPPPPPALTEVDVGVHRLAFAVPHGWLHFDHGREQRFERGTVRMSIEDLGPVDGPAFARALDDARDLWEDGRLEDARAVTARLRLRLAIREGEEWQALLAPWRIVSRAGEGATPGELDESYREVRARLAGLPLRDLETLADAALQDLGEDERRGVAAQRPVLIDDREALWIDTWDRLSHLYPKRFLFLVNEGHLLVVYGKLGALAEMEGPLDALAGSLRFP
jgi:hypothetical protein